MKKAKSFDDYLAALPDDKRKALERLRRIIKTAAPKAEEGISYGLLAFRLDGKPFIYLGASANHCAIYGEVGKEFEDELKGYDTSKGTIRFQPDKPPPAALVRKLVKFRIARNAAKRKR